MKKKIFTFKQFKIDHTLSAMKVGVDSVLLGSYVNFNEPIRLLDIGSGCGLLSLMAAQKTKNTSITGIELDPVATTEAILNGESCPWAKRIQFINKDINSFFPEEKYDYIISNPPYFKNGTKSDKLLRRQARHGDNLSIESFINNINRLLTNDGLCSFIYPYDLKQDVLFAIQSNKLHLKNILNVYPKPNMEPNRCVFVVSKRTEIIMESHIIIRDLMNNYTLEYKELTKPFYL